MRRLAMLLGVGLCLTGALCQAEVKLPSIFADHMVLQRNQPVRVWGWADAGEAISVSVEQQEHTTVANADGNWQVELKPLAAGGPLSLQVKGTNTITLSDVLVGEVWLCSGQSNMAMTVSRAMNFDQEQKSADFPTIRTFRVELKYAKTPQADAAGNWMVCSSETVGNFSAAAYFFAREIQRELDVPVGLINASFGGSPIESWIPEDLQRGSRVLSPLIQVIDGEVAKFNEEATRARYEADLAKWKLQADAAKAAGKTPSKAPTDPVAFFYKKHDIGGLFNGMVAPCIRYSFRGALWYQGEANSIPQRAAYYQHQLPLLVNSWRRLHEAGDFPFAWVQLPSYSAGGNNWPLVREAMFDALYLPATGMAITMDVGESNDIHPRDKQSVGQRLAMWALASIYDQPGTGQRQPGTGQGPVSGEAEVDGDSIQVSFAHAEDGLTLGNWKPDLRFAAIAGENQQWFPVDTIAIDGELVRFSSSRVPAPVALRYQWANDPPQTFIKGVSGIPASPFRTDDWKKADPFKP